MNQRVWFHRKVSGLRARKPHRLRDTKMFGQELKAFAIDWIQVYKGHFRLSNFH